MKEFNRLVERTLNELDFKKMTVEFENPQEREKVKEYFRANRIISQVGDTRNELNFVGRTKDVEKAIKKFNLDAVESEWDLKTK